MPFNFIEIQERKNKKIFFLFLFLIIFYLFGFYLLAVVIRTFLIFYSSLPARSIFYFPPSQISLILLSAAAVAALHWHFSVQGMIPRLLMAMDAGAPDKEDKYHQVLQNIIQEVIVATGGKPIECVVLPTMALNAFSISDSFNRAVIGVTEGLLSRLNRTQLEAVVGHEAAHIVSGDTLIKTISISLFGVYGSILKTMELSIQSSDEKGRKGNPGAFLVFLVTFFLYCICKLLNMFISRECEYRADAVAVKLLRNPLSLAQSLYIISRKWRGGGLGHEYLEGIFIFNPDYSRLDESESLFADLFSTHPPVTKRINALLGMVKIDADTMVKEIREVKPPRLAEIEVLVKPEKRWYVSQVGVWLGPFAPGELMQLPWLTHEHFIRKEGDSKIKLLYQDEELQQMLPQTQREKGISNCPRCRYPLSEALYESAKVYHCVLCKGVLVEENKLPAIISRQEQGFSEEIIREAVLIEDAARNYSAIAKVKAQFLFSCPKCAGKMLRNFYTLSYPIEVDRCLACKLLWFDKHELEVLQYLLEKAEKVLVI